MASKGGCSKLGPAHRASSRGGHRVLEPLGVSGPRVPEASLGRRAYAGGRKEAVGEQEGACATVKRVSAMNAHEWAS